MVRVHQGAHAKPCQYISYDKAFFVKACLLPADTLAQEYGQTVTVEVHLLECAPLVIESQETRSKGPMRRFVSPPLPPGKYN